MNFIKKLIKKVNKEDGMLIVEATIVFPVMFLVIFLMIFMGNAYFQKSRIDSVTTQMAYYGAAQCADPLLREIVANNKVPSLADATYSIEPYRYLIGELGKDSGMNAIETNVKSQISEKITGFKTGLFSGMKPSTTSVTAEFNNAFIYSTFEVEIDYKVPLPIRLPGAKQNFALYATSHCEVPVSDTPEFIRNVDMIGDWIDNVEGSEGVKEKIKEIMGKVASFTN